ncbi:p115 like vesicle tethering protein [Leucosporidium creatinivorum]|uniref:p115 like vesicle tethering protein n=1 Tax=Leucosporidium creatinivorum TaxID=106004 RepID=A0A1Y2DC01_9BASI|nr:p115 like vesicle tethering protein [Leucosporidium creatinivorum]
MGSYRLEYAKLGTSKCKGPKPCTGTKIPKGDLRFGTVVEFQGKTSFAWRHWGCVTQKQFNNMKQDFETAEELDGYEDLKEEDQERVAKAFEAGQVADEDIPDSARKAEADEEEEEDLKEKQGGSTKKPKKKAVPKKKKGDDDEEEKPKKKAPVKKTKAKAKKDASDSEEQEAEETDEDEKPKKKAKRARKDSDDDEAPEPRKPSSRNAGKPKKSFKEEDNSEGSEDEKPKKKAKKSKATVDSDDDDESYGALSAGAQPQSPADTIDKLCDRLLNGSQLEDRRAALLGLKGLSRDWKTEVGSRALPILLGVLQEDAPEDVEIAKAVVETLSLLCEVEEVEGRPVRDDSGIRNTDVFLATATPLHTLLTLLTPMHFYLRFFSLQLLGILLANRSTVVQGHVLTAPGGVGRLVETLDDSREIIRNESLLLIIALTTANADIQKLLAFEGAFDKLFAIVRQEGGVGGGGIVVQDCLAAIGGLLRWNVSNQNYFRETSCIPLLAPLLLFPQPSALNSQTLSAFAFQSWSEQKVINAGLVISLVRMLVGGAGTGRAGNQKALLTSGLTRCLAELALASNAPAVLKSQSLNALADILRNSPPNQEALTSLILTPLIPPLAPSSVETYHAAGDETAELDERGAPRHPSELRGEGPGGERGERGDLIAPSENKWKRGKKMPAVVATTALAVNGDGTPGREGLRVRAAAAGLFESYVASSSETQLGILSTMSAPQPENLPTDELPTEPTQSAGSILLHAMRVFPTSTRTEPFDSYTPFFGCLLFSHLLLHSESSKAAARKIYFSGDDTQPGGLGDEDDRVSLVAILVGNLMMAQREQAQSANAGLGPERGLEWSRVMVGYLIVLSIWLWESPLTVKEFLSEGSNLQVLIQPITQSSGVDSAVQGLCAFLLGICYEYCREPGPITRETLHPILQSRVGPDQFVSRILRLREDPRFRSVGPGVLEMNEDEDALEDLGEEDGLWFDFAFVEFLKTNYISVQRAILLDPSSTNPGRRSVDASASPEIVNALRSTVANQSEELDDLKSQIFNMQKEREEERASHQDQVASLTEELATLKKELTDAQEQKAEADKEQEDLLVLLEDVSSKRKGDKARMRSQGMEVSEDEEEDEDDEEQGEGLV